MHPTPPPDISWDTAPALLFELSAAGEILAINQRWHTRFGFDLEELREGALGDILADHDLSTLYDALSRIQSGGEVDFEACIHSVFETSYALSWTLTWDIQRQLISGHAQEHEVRVRFSGPRAYSEEQYKKITQNTGILPEEFVTLIETSKFEVFSILNPDTSVRYESPSLHDITGYLPEELVGRPAMDFVHPDDRVQMMQSLQRHAQHKRTRDTPFEYRFKHKTKGWIHIRSSAVMLYRNNSLHSIALVSRDISELHHKIKHLEHELERLNQRIRTADRQQEALFESVQGSTRKMTTPWRGLEALAMFKDDIPIAGMLLKRQQDDFIVIMANQHAQEQLHAPIMGALTQWSVPLLDDELLHRLHRRLAKGGSEVLPRREVTLAPGQRVQVRPVLITLDEHHIGLLMDTSKRDTINKSSHHLEPTHSLLLELNHELRTPLSSILGYSELMIEAMESNATMSLINDARRVQYSARILLCLLNNIIFLTKQRQKRGHIYLERVATHELIEEVAHSWLTLDAPLHIDVAPNLECVYTDPNTWRQILINLMFLGSESTQNRHLNVRPLEEAGPGNSQGIIMTLTLSKAPYNAKQLQSLMEAPWALGKKVIALLLSSSAQMAYALGGSFDIQETTHQDVLICIQLSTHVSLKSTHTDHMSLATPIPRAIAEAGTIKILIIDDDPAIHDLLRRDLEDEPYKLVSAMNGREGLKMARTELPDVIILDVVMPSMDGWSVLTKLKGHKQLRHIPILIQSIVHDRDLGASLGAAGYLPKPINKQKLKKALTYWTLHTP